MDPFTLLMMAQSTVAAIRKGCQMLSEGRQEIQKLKSTVEKGVGDAQAIFKEVTGLWGWLKSLLGAPKPTPVPAVKTLEPQVAPKEPKKKSKVKEADLSYEEYQSQVIHQQVENLKVLFQTLRQLREVADNLKEESASTDDIEGSALSRVEIELGIENMMTQVREAMVYAPSELRDIYGRFLKMYDLILEEREFNRQVQAKKERDRKARLWLIKRQAVTEVTALAGVILVATIVWLTLMPLIIRRGSL